MSKDQMQDVFAVNFDWKKGEQPTSEKLTGWVNQTNSAFSEITRAIGDPWEYQTHSHPLSPEKLTQASLSRFLGPADWISPQGSSWNESCNATVSLSSHRNSWSLGFPLVKVTSRLTPESTSSSISELTWSDITVLVDNNNVLVTEKSNPEDVSADGDFYVDYTKGIISSYKRPTSNIQLTITGIYMFGPGVPWGTANVIPTWKQTVGLVNITENSGSPSGGVSTYTVSLPTVTSGTRSSGTLYGSNGTNVTYSNHAPGTSTSRYRLPYAITNFNGGMSVDNEIPIPEGYILLWEEDASGTGIGRVVPNVTFYYQDEYTLKLVMVEGALDGKLGENFRIITTGTSVSEALNYLMNSTRSNNHSGLVFGQDDKTIAYNNPISHSDLSDRFTGRLVSPDSDISTNSLKYRESAYPTNDHPQYLHRSGYMANDKDGNSANAMRGDLVFSAKETFDLDVSYGGCDTETYGIKWGGGGYAVARMEFFGGVNSDTPVPFGVAGVGIITDSSTDRYGSVSYKPYYDLPFYFRSYSSLSYNSGPSLAFDYKNREEMNFIKLLPVDRTGSDDPQIISAETTQANYSTELQVSYSLTGINRPAIDEWREWRFRAISKVPSSSTTGITDATDYFVGPGVVGTDFLNLYMNAIFFSEQGDGKITSLQEQGSSWVNTTNDAAPVGIYYCPFGNSSKYSFRAGNCSGSINESLTVGYENLVMSPLSTVKVTGDTAYIKLFASDTIDIGGDGTVGDDSVATQTVDINGVDVWIGTTSTSSKIGLRTSDVYYVAPLDGQIRLHARTGLNMSSNNNIDLTAYTGGINMFADNDEIIISADHGVHLFGNYDDNNASLLLKYDGSIEMNTYSGNDINIKAYSGNATLYGYTSAILSCSNSGKVTVNNSELALEHNGDIRISPDIDNNNNGNLLIELDGVNGVNMIVLNLPTTFPGDGESKLYIKEVDVGDGDGTRKYICIDS